MECGVGRRGGQGTSQGVCRLRFHSHVILFSHERAGMGTGTGLGNAKCFEQTPCLGMRFNDLMTTRTSRRLTRRTLLLSLPAPPPSWQIPCEGAACRTGEGKGNRLALKASKKKREAFEWQKQRTHPPFSI